ncbi:MAG: hypothetical protein BM555_01395 [Crocinitomix sp. MedPE-SWsnd]|mgnify:CR=1 FL=1|nr:MAG: hypothetical protein BM555_01395 [Crocinitomix sp. MedPE-SWsnd]
MRKYKVNREQPVKLPSKEAMAKYKDFSRLTHEYDNVVKRPKKPLYKDKKMFIFIIIVALLAVLIARSMAEEEAEEETPSGTEATE